MQCDAHAETVNKTREAGRPGNRDDGDGNRDGDGHQKSLAAGWPKTRCRESNLLEYRHLNI